MTGPHNTQPRVSVVLPAKNEEKSIKKTVHLIGQKFPEYEILVVDDGSTDATATLANDAGARVLSRPYSMGNGAAIKQGVRHVDSDIVVFMDADGQHDPSDIRLLIAKMQNEGLDMVVGARRSSSHANMGRGIANAIYNRLASYMTGHAVEDLTSGFRVVHTEKFKEFLHLLPNGFSYPTTITMAFFRAGYSVGYSPITAQKREGTSHIRPVRDGLRFLLIIFKVATLYSPLKIFVPASAGMFCLSIAYYAYTFTTQGRFTNMSALLITTAILAFLIGLVSEQITQLMYQPTSKPAPQEKSDNES